MLSITSESVYEYFIIKKKNFIQRNVKNEINQI